MDKADLRGFRVKPIQWASEGASTWAWGTLVGYMITHRADGMFNMLTNGTDARLFSSLTAALDGAQDDYEKRILANLEPEHAKNG